MVLGVGPSRPEFVVDVQVWPRLVDRQYPAVQRGDRLRRVTGVEDRLVVLVEDLCLVVGNVRTLALPRHGALAECGGVHHQFRRPVRISDLAALGEKRTVRIPRLERPLESDHHAVVAAEVALLDGALRVGVDADAVAEPSVLDLVEAEQNVRVFRFRRADPFGAGVDRVQRLATVDHADSLERQLRAVGVQGHGVADRGNAVVVEHEIADALAVDGPLQFSVDLVVASERLPHVLGKQPPIGDARELEALGERENGDDGRSVREGRGENLAGVERDGVLQGREYAVLGLRKPGRDHVGINQMQACREVVELCDLLRERSQILGGSVRQRARSQQLELHPIVLVERLPDPRSSS